MLYHWFRACALDFSEWHCECLDCQDDAERDWRRAFW